MKKQTIVEGKKQGTIAQDNFKSKGRSIQVKMSGFYEAKYKEVLAQDYCTVQYRNGSFLNICSLPFSVSKRTVGVFLKC